MPHDFLCSFLCYQECMYRKRKNLLFPTNSFFFNPVAIKCPLIEEWEANYMMRNNEKNIMQAIKKYHNWWR